jgi:DDE superfamily endonuclease
LCDTQRRDSFYQHAGYMYACCATDKNTVQNNQILSHMVEGDLILAEKGFLISELRCQSEFTPTECSATCTIARARTLIERAIQRVINASEFLGRCCVSSTYVQPEYFSYAHHKLTFNSGRNG